MKKELFTELIWILSLLAVSLCIDLSIFGSFSIFKAQLDMQLHDTYMVIPGIRWFFALFVFIAAFVYLVKEASRRFSHILPNLILAILLVSTLFIILQGHSMMYHMQSMHQWEVYPPLSALAEEGKTIAAPSPPLWNVAFMVVELIMLIGLFLLGFKTGRLTGGIS